MVNEKKKLRIATRKSPLACYQADVIRKALKVNYPFLTIELLPMFTEGDRKNTFFSYSKGFFVNELEKALLSGQADIAVHSMKDLPMYLAKDLVLGAVYKREDPRDVLISRLGQSLSQLNQGACVGTSSLRRQSQLMALRPDLKVRPLRGNVGTRLNRLMSGPYDAIVLAAAGLIRLKKTKWITQYLEINSFLPAPGQGALGIECREQDIDSRTYVKRLMHWPTYYCITAERSISQQLGGGCQVPMGAYASLSLSKREMSLEAFVSRSDGTSLIKIKEKINLKGKDTFQDAQKLGNLVAEALRAQGAEAILQDLP